MAVHYDHITPDDRVLAYIETGIHFTGTLLNAFLLFQTFRYSHLLFRGFMDWVITVILFVGACWGLALGIPQFISALWNGMQASPYENTLCFATGIAMMTCAGTTICCHAILALDMKAIIVDNKHYGKKQFWSMVSFPVTYLIVCAIIVLTDPRFVLMVDTGSWCFPTTMYPSNLLFVGPTAGFMFLCCASTAIICYCYSRAAAKVFLKVAKPSSVLPSDKSSERSALADYDPEEAKLNKQLLTRCITLLFLFMSCYAVNIYIFTYRVLAQHDVTHLPQQIAAVMTALDIVVTPLFLLYDNPHYRAGFGKYRNI